MSESQRAALREEMDELRRHSPEFIEREMVTLGGPERLLDLWLAHDIQFSARSFYLNRYADEPRIHDAIEQLRLAAKELSEALHERVRRRRDRTALRGAGYERRGG